MTKKLSYGRPARAFALAMLFPLLAVGQNFSVGEMAPSYALTSYDGTTISSAANAGSITMIFFLGHT